MSSDHRPMRQSSLARCWPSIDDPNRSRRADAICDTQEAQFKPLNTLRIEQRRAGKSRCQKLEAACSRMTPSAQQAAPLQGMGPGRRLISGHERG